MRPWATALLVIVGVAVAIMGVALIAHPFSSVTLLILLIALGLIVGGAGEFLAWWLQDAAEGRAWARSVIGIASVVAGVLVLALPGLTVRVVVVLIGVLLIVGGMREFTTSFDTARGRADRWANGLLGTAGVILGFCALAWPDVTVMLGGAIFGVWLLISGLRIAITEIVRMASRRRTRSSHPRPVLKAVLGGLALVGAVAVAVLGMRFAATPQPDAFYDAPAAMPAEPGVLIRSEPFDRAVPEGARAWRILYSTTDLGGGPTVASGLVLVPDTPGEHPVIGWTHGTTGIATGCAPSLLPEPFVSGAMPDLDQAVARGWAVVATDYIGLGTKGQHEYVVGPPAAQAQLDALRAARQLEGIELADETVLWGHSQGGHAALWTAGLAPDYAPELDILGVAAMAPAANLPALLESFAGEKLSILFGAFVLHGYAAAYPDVQIDRYVKPAARLTVDEIAARCLSDRATIVSAIEAGFSGGPVWSRDPSTGALAQRAAENVPRLPIEFPLLLAQGLADPLITPEAQNEYVAALCEAGQAVDYRTYPGRDHMGVVTGDSPLLGELLAWTEDRLEGRAARDTC